MSEKSSSSPLGAEIEQAQRDLQENLQIGDSAARIIAEDEVYGGVPSHSSEEVEEERVRRAQELDKA